MPLDKKKDETSSSFSGCGAYLKALSLTPKRFRQRAAATSSAEEEMVEMRKRSGSEMKRKLEWYDLVAIGVGGMLGSGIFLATGEVANQISGPSVVLAYVVAGVSALLSALCYTEFAVEMPVAGGAFSYLRITFGEFAAFIAGANLILEYVLSNAGVARSFTTYFASIFKVGDANKWRIHVDGLAKGYNELDLLAVVIVLIITAFLCHSTRESSMLNLGITFLHLLLFGFIIVAGLMLGKWDNLTKPADTAQHASGFFPFGALGVFNGAASVYFSYIGFDSASTLAEEIRNPTKSLPIGVSGSVFIVSVIYCLMSLALCVMVPYDKISTGAPFTDAFKHTPGWEWGAVVVGLGGSIGILASLIVAMLGQARYFCVIGRARLIPYCFAKVHPKTGTPLNATVFLGICTAVIAMFTELKVLLEMMSIGILLVFYMVANALIYHRYVKPGTTSSAAPTAMFLMAMSATSIGFAVWWQSKNQESWGLLGFGLANVATTSVFWKAVPVAHYPNDWSLPCHLMPWLPSASIFLNVFLLSTLHRMAYVRFGVWSCISIAFYALYSVHSSHDAQSLPLLPYATFSSAPPPPPSPPQPPIQLHTKALELSSPSSPA